MCKSVKGIIFDLDGVLTDTASYHYLAWKRIADEWNVYFDKEINNRLKGVDRMTSLEILLERSNAKYTPEQKVRIAEKKNNYYNELINNISPSDLYPGIHDLFDKIKHMKIKKALASASKNAKRIIKQLQIENLFEAVVDANFIENSKPDPEIFLKAADMLGLKYSECAVIEDSLAGIAAAKTAGMIAVGIGSGDVLSCAHLLYEKTADIRIEDINEILC